MSKFLLELKQSVKDLLSNYPMEVLAVIILPFAFGVMFGMAVVLLAYVLNKAFNGKYKLLYYILSVVLVLVMTEIEPDLRKNVPSWLAFNLSVIVLFLFYHRSENRKEYVSHFVRKVEVLLFTVAVYLGVHIIVAILSHWLWNDETKAGYAVVVDTVTVFEFLLAMVLGCWYKKRVHGKVFGSIVKVIFCGIFPAFIFILTALLYYQMIVFICEMNFFGYGYIGPTMILVVLLMVCSLATEHYGTPFLTKIFKIYPWIVLPLLVVFWICVIGEICAYSLTEYRVLQLLGGALVSLYIAWRLLGKEVSYRIISVASFISIALFTTIPVCSAYYIGANVQAERLMTIGKECGLLDDEGNLKKTIIQINPKEGTLWYDAYLYVRLNGEYVTDKKAVQVCDEISGLIYFSPIPECCEGD